MAIPRGAIFALRTKAGDGNTQVTVGASPRAPEPGREAGRWPLADLVRRMAGGRAGRAGAQQGAGGGAIPTLAASRR